MNLKLWMIFELSLQDSQHSLIIRTLMGKFSCYDQWRLDLNQLVQMTKMSQSCRVEFNKTWTAREKPSEHWHLSCSHSEVWHCIQSAKLPAKHPDIPRSIFYSTWGTIHPCEVYLFSHCVFLSYEPHLGREQWRNAAERQEESWAVGRIFIFHRILHFFPVLDDFLHAITIYLLSV